MRPTVSVRDEPDSSPVETGLRAPPQPAARPAALVFAAVTAVALPLLLALGNYHWFFFDDWDFIAGRDGGSIVDLLRPHNEHWSTLPVIAYRLLWRAFGLTSYVPYQFLVVALHLTAAALLRVVMRRAGVHPWVATAAAALFVFFGAGDQNIVFAFQIGFVGALVLGLTHLLLVDHDGPLDRRDVLGLVAGAAGLLCAGVAVTMTIVVGVAALIRRGWRVAVFHTAPLGALYVLWWVTYGDRYYDGPGIRGLDGFVVRFVAANVKGTFRELGYLPGLGIAVAALLVVGYALALRRLADPDQRDEARRKMAAPSALLLGALVFLLISGVGRADVVVRLTGTHEASRYLHLVAALSLPALAIAVETAARRWRAVGPVAAVLLLIGIVGGVRTFLEHRDDASPLHAGFERLVLTTPTLPIARQLPRSHVVEPATAGDLTVGWLLDGVEAGRVPDPGPVTDAQRATITLGLIVRPSGGALPDDCRRHARPLLRAFSAGDTFAVRGGRAEVSWVPESGRGASRTFADGVALEVRADVTLLIAATDQPRLEVCL